MHWQITTLSEEGFTIFGTRHKDCFESAKNQLRDVIKSGIFVGNAVYAGAKSYKEKGQELTTTLHEIVNISY